MRSGSTLSLQGFEHPSEATEEQAVVGFVRSFSRAEACEHGHAAPVLGSHPGARDRGNAEEDGPARPPLDPDGEVNPLSQEEVTFAVGVDEEHAALDVVGHAEGVVALLA